MTDHSALESFTLDQLKSRTSVKWTEYSEQVLPLWVAEMDSSTVPAVATVVSQMLTFGDTGYPGHLAPSVADARAHEVDYRRLPTYQAAYVAFAKERWGLDLTVDQIAQVQDVMQGIMHAITITGIKNLVINTPVYPPFRFYPVEAGASVAEAPLSVHGRLDFEALAEMFADADGFLLCNPHNPTGVAHTREELTQLFELARAHNVRVIVDEIHAPLTSPAEVARTGSDPFVPALSVPGSERAVVLFSSAKGFHLAGFKAALLIVGKDAMGDLEKLPGSVFHSSSSIALAAHTAALVHGGEWLDEVREGIDQRREQLSVGLRAVAPAAKILPAVSTYFAWVDFSAVEVAGRPLGNDAASFLFEKAKVAFNPGDSFGAGGEGHVRVNLATSQEVIAEALRRIAAALG